uniref:Putative mitochondrial intermembrane space import and assembly protein 40 n=1 Tax=Xenopsylla cheopis TaxID=163159 RepID=A0A6M2DSI7_XENCH
MSYCQKKDGGKDIVIFATKEDHEAPSSVILPEPDPTPGLILPNGEINWNCPCLGGMATGPCGVPFRDAFSCFHYSQADPKGSDCFDKFKEMQDCMSQYPALYNKHTKDDDDDDDALDKVFEQAEEETTNNSKDRENEHLSIKDKSNI